MSEGPSKRSNLPQEISVIGHAIVSANGMIADAEGHMPDEMIVEADQLLFQKALDESALVVLGRRGHEKHPSKGRRRLVATRSVKALGPDPTSENAYLWNPAGLAFPAVLHELSVHKGIVSITGGQAVFDLCLPFYTGFALSEVHGFELAGGIACFSGGHPRDVLADAGLLPGKSSWLAQGISGTYWRAAG